VDSQDQDELDSLKRLKNSEQGQAWWFMPVLSAMQEAEMGESQFKKPKNK
jgi:hypothetical protein